MKKNFYRGLLLAGIIVGMPLIATANAKSTSGSDVDLSQMATGNNTTKHATNSTSSSVSSDKPTVNIVNGYQVSDNDQYRLRVVTQIEYGLWNTPYLAGTSKAIGSSASLNQKLVKITQVAVNQAGSTYFHIVGLGPKLANHDLGWISSEAVSQTATYELPFYYSSQLYPTYAPDACEAIALKMALSVKGYAMNVANKDFIDGIPRSSNPDVGYTNDPYRYGSHATIYPAALAKYAGNWTNDAQDITGASVNKLIYEIRHGNPVVFEGSYRMQNTKSDHILVIVGYKPGYFKIADPYMYRKSQNKIFWTSVSNFYQIFNTKKRGARAMVLN